MKLEDQVCGLDLAMKIKELGYPQDSWFFWMVDEYGNSFLKVTPRLDTIENLQRRKGTNKYYSSFTVAELGEMLKGRGVNSFYNYIDVDKWAWSSIQPGTKIFFNADNEADARAKMLIYLLENKLMILPKDKKCE